MVVARIAVVSLLYLCISSVVAGDALMDAVKRNDENMVRKLLREGADVNHTDANGCTALHEAIIRGYHPIAKLLIENRAALNIHDKGGNTPLIYAALQGHENIVRMLLDKGADKNLRNGKTALDVANQLGHTKIAEMLRRA